MKYSVRRQQCHTPNWEKWLQQPNEGSAGPLISIMENVPTGSGRASVPRSVPKTTLPRTEIVRAPAAAIRPE